MTLGLPLAPGAVLKSLAYHAHQDGTNARPGMQRICLESGLAERAAQRALQDLETNGLIERVTDNRGGRNHMTEYRLLMAENPVPKDVLNPVFRTPFIPAKPRISGQETPHMGTLNPASKDIPSRAGVVPPPPRTSIEPQIEGVWSKAGVYVALSDIQKYSVTAKDQALIDQWLDNHEYSPDTAEAAASAMASKIEFKNGKWFAGKYSYSDIPRAYYGWVRREARFTPSPSLNGRDGMGTAEQFKRNAGEQARRKPLPKVRVNL